MTTPVTTRLDRLRRRRVARHALALLAAAALASGALAGCGGDDSEDASDGAGRDSLADAFGVPDFGVQSSSEQFADQDRQAEALTAECMAEQGFEYTPRDVDAADMPDFTDTEARVELARTDGFGVALSIANPEFSLTRDAEEDLADDPNAARLEAMSESEAAAYQEALYGATDEAAAEVDPDTGEEFFEMGGCQGEAFEAVYGGDSAFTAMEPFYEEIQERADADPRYQEHMDRWRACMTDEGFEYEDIEAVYDYAYGDFAERVQEVVGFDPQMGALGTLTPEQEAQLAEVTTPEEAERLVREFEENALAGVDRAALEALQEEERALAVAEAECTTPVLPDLDEVFRDIEARYVDENADRIAEAARQLGD